MPRGVPGWCAPAFAVAVHAGATLAGAQEAPSPSPSPGIQRSLTVPLDHARPEGGRATLRYELGAPFDPARPTVLVIADGQQYYLRPGATAALQRDVFGDRVNLVGILTRGSTPEFVQAALDPEGRPDWLKAWRIFNSSQWVEDIDAVRRAVAGDRGRVMVFGRSGGGYLVHQYLVRHGAHVSRAFTQSAVNPRLTGDLRIPIERFWDSLDRTLQGRLRDALAAEPPDRRLSALVTLQRQHFFVPAAELPAARAELIRALAARDADRLAQAVRDYQVEEVLELSRSTEAIPQHVRVLELLFPAGAFSEEARGTVRPLIESQRHFLSPLLALIEQKRIEAPSFDLAPAHALDTEIFILASRWDEAVDYRTLIALAHAHPRQVLFIADDNHVFTRMDERGVRSRLLRAFFEGGPGSPAMAAAMQEAEPLRWREGGAAAAP
jgi:pimeloyl-ACP methyl ester carboxylesterase